MTMKQRNVKLDERANEKLEQLVALSGKNASQVVRELLAEGELRVSTRIGDKTIQEELSRFHDDMNTNYLHTNTKLEQVEEMVARLGEKAAANNKTSELLCDVDKHLLEIKQHLAAYRRQGDKEASELVNLQR